MNWKYQKLGWGSISRATSFFFIYFLYLLKDSGKPWHPDHESSIMVSLSVIHTLWVTLLNIVGGHFKFTTIDGQLITSSVHQPTQQTPRQLFLEGLALILLRRNRDSHSLLEQGTTMLSLCLGQSTSIGFFKDCQILKVTAPVNDFSLLPRHSLVDTLRL